MTGAITANGLLVVSTPATRLAAPWASPALQDEAGGNRMRRKGAETMSALAAQGIRKSFRRRQVLAGVEVAAGELVAVVGENGTGKPTPAICVLLT